jgi:hypothetical protein
MISTAAVKHATYALNRCVADASDFRVAFDVLTCRARLPFKCMLETQRVYENAHPGNVLNNTTRCECVQQLASINKQIRSIIILLL